MLGGGVAGAGELLVRPIREEIAPPGPCDGVADHRRGHRAAGHRRPVPSARRSTAPSGQRSCRMTRSSRGRGSPGPRRPGRAGAARGRGRPHRGHRARRRPARRSVRDARVRGRPCPWLGRPRRHGRSGGPRRHEPARCCGTVSPRSCRQRVTAPVPDAGRRSRTTVRAWMPGAPDDGARPLGFNIEGPFISEAKRGAHNPA